MKKLLVLAFLCCAASGIAQTQSFRLIIMANPDNLPIWAWPVDNAEIRDSTVLTAGYSMEYIPNPETGHKSRNTMYLQIGRKWSKYYSQIREDKDAEAAALSNAIGRLGQTAPAAKRSAKQNAPENSSMNGELWIDNSSRSCTERYHSLTRYNESVEYDEPLPDFDWVLHRDTLTVCGKYPCMKASARFRGREWTVWYTTEIPISSGPWKFNGLPGLILKAEDSKGEYKWECVELQRSSVPIYYRRAHITRTTREKYREYMKRFCEHPLHSLAQGENITVKSRGKILDESWAVPYNPIELQ